MSASCHGGSPGGSTGPSSLVGAGRVAPADMPRVALVGSPNGGKSTLFNALTGMRRSVGNWPGTSVEVGTGMWVSRGAEDPQVMLLDLPGAYSLDPTSPDEALTRSLVWDAPADQAPELVVVTVDTAHLARSLYLVAQLRERPLRLVVALTMVDVAARRGITVDDAALAEALGVPVVRMDPRKRHGYHALVTAVRRALRAPVTPARPAADVPDLADPASVDALGSDPVGEADLRVADDRFAWIDAAVEAGLHRSDQGRVTWSDRLDRWTTAPYAGAVIFLVMMWLVFQVTTTVAAPLQNALDGLVAGPVTDGARSAFAAVGWAESPVAGLVCDGLIAGVGMLLTFVPLMALMFALLAVLEDSGYMARAAVVTDRLMRRLGLPGRAFLPLVVGFGCNVPAISATRILGNTRQRVLVALLVPFTSCTARLTVYVMLAEIFFPRYAGTVVFGMYVLSIALVVAVGMLLRRTLWRTMGSEPLLLDLPPYQRPVPRLVLCEMWLRLQGFLRTASGIIVAAVTVVWLLQATPAHGKVGFGEVQVADSAYAALAEGIAPVFTPAGFGSWETTGALVVGFVAKEAVVSSWAQTYAVADPVDGGPDELNRHIQAAFEQSSGGHPTAAALAFLVFLLAYTPCVATLAAQRREIGTRWSAFGIALQLVTAWVLAVAVFQISRALW